MAEADHRVAAYLRAAGIGVVAGIRSQLPLALLSLAAHGGGFASGSGLPLSLFRTRTAMAITGMAALTELIADKLPIVPSRLAPGPLLGRLVFGGLAGAAVALDATRSPLLGGLSGMAGAGTGAFAGYWIRAVLRDRTPVPDPALGALEDGVALGIGRAALRGGRGGGRRSHRGSGRNEEPKPGDGQESRQDHAERRW